jgi:dCMP deaminase
MLHAHVIRQRSTCTRLNVGVVIARDHRILVTGYNGAPAGMPHCNHTCTCESQVWTPGVRYGEDGMDHHPMCSVDKLGCTVAVHAEANAIAWAARYGVTLDGTELFTTHAPCLPCAQLIINAGIMRVVFGVYYRDKAGLKLLESAHISVELGVS